jgi:long-subunit fatty acid transport protein
MSLDTLRSISKGIAFNETTFGDLFTDIGVNEVSPMTKLKADSLSYGFALGLLYDINSKLTIGISYVSRQHFELEGTLKLNANRQIDVLKPDVIPLLSLLPNQGQNGLIGKWDVDIPFTLPQKAGVGLSYRPTEKWMFAFDITWIDWKDFLGGDWVVKLSNGNSEDLNAIVGSPDFTSSFPQKWSNGIIYSFGVEHQLSPVCILRAGYATGNRIVPSNTITPVGPVISKHHLTFGTGYKFEIFEFNIAYEHILKNSSSRVQSHQVSSFYEDARTSVSVNTVHMMCSWHF